MTLFWFLMTLARMSEDSCSLDCAGTGVDSDLAGEGRGVEVVLGAAVGTSASKSSIRRFVITEKAPTRAFSWLKAATTAFTFKTLC